MRLLLWFVLLAAGSLGLRAQVEVALEQERTSYLLYEPVNLKLTLRNNSGQDLAFVNGSSDQPWLSFLVSRSGGGSVRPDQDSSFAPLTLATDEARALVINVTPLYRFRETGTYRVRAVIDLSGRQFLSAPIEFTVANGNKIWKETRIVDGSPRMYSLLRFSPNAQATYLYLRIEDEAENLVYTTASLGEMVAFTPPQVLFDKEGALHILHVSGKGAYRYSRSRADGTMEAQKNFVSVNDSQPQLIAAADGAISVAGGRRDDESTRRERLTEAQKLMRRVPPVTSLPGAGPPVPPSNANNPPG